MPNVTINLLKMEGIGNREEWFRKGEETYPNGEKEKYCIFDFNKIIPTPETEEECDHSYNFNITPQKYIQPDDNKPWFNWYKWKIDIWGTKWNGLECKIINNDAIKFETAWSPADGIMQELSRSYYKDRVLLLFYNDEYDCYWYANEYRNGDVTSFRLSEQISRYPDNDDYSKILENLEKEYLKHKMNEAYGLSTKPLDYTIKDLYSENLKVTEKERKNTMTKNFDKVVVNGPATIAWINGKKIMVKKSEEDAYDYEKAMLALMVKSFFGDEARFHRWCRDNMKLINKAVEKDAKMSASKMSKKNSEVEEKPTNKPHRHDRWTREELDFLLANYKAMSNKSIGDVLGRSCASVQTQLFRLHLKR